MGGGIAGILIGVVAPMIVYHTDAQGNKVVSASSMSLIAGIFSVCAIICYLLCYTLTTEYDELAAGQTQAVANGIYNLSTFFPAVIYILCGLVLLFVYPLSKSKVEANVAELQSRRAAEK